jgi:hypothetical protein
LSFVSPTESIPDRLLALALIGCNRQATPIAEDNTVAAYLDGAERQAETDEQRREIARALHDALELTPDELRERRYAGYGMNPDAWTAVELLSHHFVPTTPMTLEETSFYRDVGDPAARAAIQEQLDALERAAP